MLIYFHHHYIDRYRNTIQLYFEYFDRLNKDTRQPDRIICFQCSDLDVLMGRIRNRGRKEEQSIPVEFLEGLNGYYSAFPQSVKAKYGIKVMTFDVTHFDIHDPAQADAFCSLADAFLNNDDEKTQKKTKSHDFLNNFILLSLRCAS